MIEIRDNDFENILCILGSIISHSIKKEDIECAEKLISKYEKIMIMMKKEQKGD